MYFSYISILCFIPIWSQISCLKDVDYRLPNNSIPEAYKIKLDPHLEVGNFTFTGQVQILLNVLQKSNDITLHAKNLSIVESKTELRFDSANGTTYPIENHEYNNITDFLILRSIRPLPAGMYSLTLYFTGTLNDRNIGFYRSSYKDSKKGNVWIATTQFQATNARYAFPCYDEPGLKTIFQIMIKRTKSQTALSNTPILSEDQDSNDGKIWSTFSPTPRMPTYLVAFIVADYQSVKSADNRSRVWTRPDAINHTHYALKIGEKALESISKYLNISFYENMLPKMDQISIPDFDAGAMENWGLVTYRERLLLFQDSISSELDRQSIASVIFHEFAHQWFGNLVSPLWWNYVWLNEGFATYFEFFGTALVESNWRLEDQFVVKEMHSQAFQFDVASAAHPMNADVNSPNEIRSIFDDITYAKAACIIRMLRHIITEKVFKAGLTNYLTANKYGSGTPEKLWKGIQKAIDDAGMIYNISQIMTPWINEKGVPLVRVERNYSSNIIHFSQEVFNVSHTNSSEPGKWWIPLNGVSSGNLDFAVTAATSWISGTPHAYANDVGATLDEWIIINNQQTGYYRVMYDLENWRRLISFLNTGNYTKIHPINRAQLIDDSLSLANAGYLNYTVALELIQYLRREIDYIPWYSAFSGISHIDRMMVYSSSYEAFRKYMRNLISFAEDTVGFNERPSDEHVLKLQRSNVLKFACYFGQSECSNMALSAVKKWLDNNDDTAVPRNLKNVYYCASIRNSNITLWDRMWEEYLVTTRSSEKSMLLIALGCSDDKIILNRFMKYATTRDSGIRLQDSTTAFSAVYANNPQNVDIALDFIIKNLDDIAKYYGNNSSVASLLTAIGNRVTKENQLEKLLELSKNHSKTVGSISSAIKTAQENLIWIEKYQRVVGDWCTTKLSTFNLVTDDDASSASFNHIFSSLMFISPIVYFIMNG